MSLKIINSNGALFLDPDEDNGQGLVPEWLTKFTSAVQLLKGGPGSGNFGHGGVPGQRGGSAGGRGGLGGGGGGGAGEVGETKFNTTKKTVNALAEPLGKKPTANSGQQGVYSANVSASKVKPVKAKLKEMGFEEYDDPWVQQGVSSWQNDAKVHVRISEPFTSFFDKKPTVNVSISQETGLANIPQGQ